MTHLKRWAGVRVCFFCSCCAGEIKGVPSDILNVYYWFCLCAVVGWCVSAGVGGTAVWGPKVVLKEKQLDHDKRIISVVEFALMALATHFSNRIFSLEIFFYDGKWQREPQQWGSIVNDNRDVLAAGPWRFRCARDRAKGARRQKEERERKNGAA